MGDFPGISHDFMSYNSSHAGPSLLPALVCAIEAEGEQQRHCEGGKAERCLKYASWIRDVQPCLLRRNDAYKSKQCVFYSAWTAA